MPFYKVFQGFPRFQRFLRVFIGFASFEWFLGFLKDGEGFQGFSGVWAGFGVIYREWTNVIVLLNNCQPHVNNLDVYICRVSNCLKQLKHA